MVQSVVRFMVYWVAAILCLLCARGHRHYERRRLWVGIGIAFFALGAVSPIITAIASVIRDAAIGTEWYQGRLAFQVLATLGSVIAGGMVLFIGLRRAGSRWRRLVVPLSCAVLLAVLTVARALSAHDLDQILGWGIGWLDAGCLLETVLVGIVYATTLRTLSRRRARLRRS